MAKKHKNAQKFPIQWNGIVVGGENQGDSIPTSVELKWAGEYIPCLSLVVSVITSITSGPIPSPSTNGTIGLLGTFNSPSSITILFPVGTSVVE